MTTTMLDTPKLATGGQKTCFNRVTLGGYRILLMQHPTRKHRSFSVQYGLQLDHDLTYAEACQKLGEAIMHSLACESRLDNERD